MKVIVDTNIVFSAILNSTGLIGNILLDPASELEFISPNFLRTEISRKYIKLLQFSKLNESQLSTSIEQVISVIKLIDENNISLESWIKSYNLLVDIDEKDIPFVALAIEFNGIIWTGDRKLIKGLKSKQYHSAFSTQEMKQFRIN